MQISYNSPEYLIPSYNLTGDLLAFRTCELRYRYYSMGSLPPTKPIQQWFGNFIHSVMEESFNYWNQPVPTYNQFPWDWFTQIRPIEQLINRRLVSSGLPTASYIFCSDDQPTSTPRGCPDNNHPHKLLASRRTDKSLNTWGPHLFPIMSDAEVKISGIRPMPTPTTGAPRRSDYYEMKGIIDVISGFNINNAPKGNLILRNIMSNPTVINEINNQPGNQYEVIIDYKGMRRPNKNSTSWFDHEWQILTYAWLRMKQTKVKPLVGLLFYLNELEPSEDGMELLKAEISATPPETDILPTLQSDRNAILNFVKRNQPIPPNLLSTNFKEDRSIRIILIDPNLIDQSLNHFDIIVGEIEDRFHNETQGVSIPNNWDQNPGDPRTCNTCDFQAICDHHQIPGSANFSIP